MKCQVAMVLLSAGELVGVASASMQDEFSRPPVWSSSRAAGVESSARSGLTPVDASRRLEESEASYGFVSGHSLKFQGCHHISQWNSEASDEDSVRIMTKRLARFRLCPAGTCDGSKANGCTSTYGDYIADLNTFVHYYLTSMAEEAAGQCSLQHEQCQAECGDDSNDNDACLYQCFATAGLTGCMDDDDDTATLDPLTYAHCAAFDALQSDDGTASYLGPYCSEQGGAVYMGLFTDSSCSTFSSCDSDCFTSKLGYQLPYSASTLIPPTCLSCSQNYLYDDDGQNYNVTYGVRETCQAIYSVSGKCETRMQLDYPNEAACTYIEGIKIVKEDGSIRTMSVRKSKAAAVGIGLFTTIAVLLTAYVCYLRTKLGRAKINLYQNSGAVMA